jgi:HlyD family secretion protein
MARGVLPKGDETRMDIERKDLARKRKVRRILMIVVALLAMGAITYGVSKLEPAAPTVDGSITFPDTVERGDMTIDVRGLGTLVPEEIVLIPARDEGRVEKRNLQAGMAVEPDTVLIELSNPELEQEVFNVETEIEASEAEYADLEVQLETERLDQAAQAAEVRGDYEKAKAQYNVDKELYDEGLMLSRSRITVEQLEKQVAIEEDRLKIRKKAVDAQLAAKRARINQQERLLQLQKEKLQRLKVRAGISGVLQQMEVEVGQLVTPGTVLARVSDPRRLKAELKISETQAKDVSVGQRALINTRVEDINGEVIRVDPAVLDGTVTVDVRLEGDLPNYLRPDLSVDGRVILDHLEDVVKVGRPVYAQRDSKISLFRKEPDGIHAVRVQVTVGRTSVNEIEILDGLMPGDVVILSDMSAWDEYDRIRLE